MVKAVEVIDGAEGKTVMKEFKALGASVVVPIAASCGRVQFKRDIAEEALWCPSVTPGTRRKPTFDPWASTQKAYETLGLAARSVFLPCALLSAFWRRKDPTEFHSALALATCETPSPAARYSAETPQGVSAVQILSVAAALSNPVATHPAPSRRGILESGGPSLERGEKWRGLGTHSPASIRHLRGKQIQMIWQDIRPDLPGAKITTTAVGNVPAASALMRCGYATKAFGRSDKRCLSSDQQEADIFIGGTANR